ncbi:hypothetical protein JAAARDRAFT_211850 [Jaapia argillacea MUCL 33604]|uniref:Uncharacterized protein n=1 Tax=Jaapia argillacea MUCL 33604 TaxID=933084 RepID=A0A067P8V4_9AGAM|nr:hypothetical protein JAAARDRAFT_211850 [Jaapia argillacea MUCL 33604]
MSCQDAPPLNAFAIISILLSYNAQLVLLAIYTFLRPHALSLTRPILLTFATILYVLTTLSTYFVNQDPNIFNTFDPVLLAGLITLTWTHNLSTLPPPHPNRPNPLRTLAPITSSLPPLALLSPLPLLLSSITLPPSPSCTCTISLLLASLPFSPSPLTLLAVWVLEVVAFTAFLVHQKRIKAREPETADGALKREKTRLTLSKHHRTPSLPQSNRPSQHHNRSNSLTHISSHPHHHRNKAKSNLKLLFALLSMIVNLVWLSAIWVMTSSDAGYIRGCTRAVSGVPQGSFSMLTTLPQISWPIFGLLRTFYDVWREGRVRGEELKSGVDLSGGV